MNQQYISVIGIGYVGLSTALGFTAKNYDVVASDSNKTKVENTNQCKLPFHEPNLEKQLKIAVQRGKLKCVPNTKEAMLSTSVTFVTVGTPSQPDDAVNLQYIKKAVFEIGSALKQKNTYHLIVIKSTVTPTTTEKELMPLIEFSSAKRCGTDFGLCMNPEFLREGTALYDTLHPDRIVIGEYDKKSGDTLKNLYQEFHAENTPPIIRTNLSTAEMIKYANNAFLATKVSYINTIANICEKTPDTDVAMVAKGIGLDKRISPLFLNAGLGYGGSCLPKDVKALIAFSRSLGYKAELLDSVEKVNKTQPCKAVSLCKSLLNNLENRNIALLGLAFKPNTDDMRNAVSIPITHQLLKENVNITAYDPVAIPNAQLIFKNKIKYADSAIACIKNADCCIVVTEWDEFSELKPEDFKKQMKRPILIDGRRIYNPETYGKKLKFAAVGIG